jgi:3-hydroxyisobutyrate dehydrogenase-like beta-hydroxyacid dehydrogenase
MGSWKGQNQEVFWWDMSSIAPLASQEISAKAKEQGVIIAGRSRERRGAQSD